MLSKAILLSLLTLSVGSALAAPIPGNVLSKPVKPKPKPKPSPDSAANDSAIYALAARDLSSSDLDSLSFERRSLPVDVSGEMDVFERGIGEEDLELYIRGLLADYELEKRNKKDAAHHQAAANHHQQQAHEHQKQAGRIKRGLSADYGLERRADKAAYHREQAAHHEKAAAHHQAAGDHSAAAKHSQQAEYHHAKAKSYSRRDLVAEPELGRRNSKEAAHHQAQAAHHQSAANSHKVANQRREADRHQSAANDHRAHVALGLGGGCRARREGSSK